MSNTFNDLTGNRYCVGFALDKDLKNVLLLIKDRPDWQRGKLNGVGGQVEDNESDIEAMVREFEEETTLKSTMDDWHYFGTIKGEKYDVICFYSVMELYKLLNARGEETPIVVPIDNIKYKKVNTMPAVDALISTILLKLNDHNVHDKLKEAIFVYENK